MNLAEYFEQECKIMLDQEGADYFTCHLAEAMRECLEIFHKHELTDHYLTINSGAHHLMRLLNYKPVTPIAPYEDDPSLWVDLSNSFDKNEKMYQSKRCFSLWYHPDQGFYSYNDAYNFTDNIDSDATFTTFFLNRDAEEHFKSLLEACGMYPARSDKTVTMPFYPPMEKETFVRTWLQQEAYNAIENAYKDIIAEPDKIRKSYDPIVVRYININGFLPVKKPKNATDLVTTIPTNEFYLVLTIGDARGIEIPIIYNWDNIGYRDINDSLQKDIDTIINDVDDLAKSMVASPRDHFFIVPVGGWINEPYVINAIVHLPDGVSDEDRVQFTKRYLSLDAATSDIKVNNYCGKVADMMIPLEERELTTGLKFLKKVLDARAENRRKYREANPIESADCCDSTECNCDETPKCECSLKTEPNPEV